MSTPVAPTGLGGNGSAYKTAIPGLTNFLNNPTGAPTNLNDWISGQQQAQAQQPTMPYLLPNSNMNQLGGVGTSQYGPYMPSGNGLQPDSTQGASDNSQLSPLDQLMQQEQSQIAGIGNISNYEMPYSQIQAMAQNETNAQYDPQINNLLGQIAQQKQQTSVNQGLATNMYNALGNSYIQDIPQVQAQAATEQAAAKSQYTNAQQQLQNQYQNQSTQQQAALDKLGIQAAAGGGSSGNATVAAQEAPGVQGVGQQQKTDQNYLQGQLTLQQQQAQNLLSEQANSATQYQNSMADSSKLQGANDVTNLQNALSNYLTGAQTQQQSLVSGKADALAGMLGQLQWQNLQNAQTQYQNAFSRVMDENNYNLDVQKESDSNTQAANTLLNNLQVAGVHYGAGTVNMPGTTGNSGGAQGAANYLANLYGSGNTSLNAQSMQGILQAVNNAMTDANSQNTYAQQHGQRIRTDMPYYQGYLQQEMQKAGITDSSDLATAYQALLAYNQQLK